MPRYLTSSTLWYSGIFAAAATFDAGVKERRREQWDLAIADAKKELEITEAAVVLHETRKEQGQIAETVLQLRASDSQRHALQIVSRSEDLERAGLLDWTVERQDSENCESSATFKPFFEEEELDIFRNIDPTRPNPHFSANTGHPMNVYRVAPQSVYATKKSKERWTETTQIPKKNAATQMAVEMLQLTLFRELQRRGWSEDAAKAVPEDFAQHLLMDETEQIRRMRNKRSAWNGLVTADDYLEGYVPFPGDITFCNFSDVGKRVAKKHWYRLDEALREIFDLEANGQMSRPALYAKVAYNLSITPTAPSVKTFNTLLLGFGRLKDRGIIDPLIAYIRRAHVRTDEVTLGFILNHYTRTNQPANFAHWVKLMRGKHGGLMLARPDVPINGTSEGRLITHQEDPNKVVQLPYANPHVFKALIEGVLKFSGFEAALTICQNMGAEGWGLCIKGLTPLLLHCASQADWKSGHAIWTQIHALKASSKRRHENKMVSERITFPTYAAMLMLCSKCGKETEFNRVYDEALKARVQSNLIVGLKDAMSKHAQEVETLMTQTREASEPVPEWHDNEDYHIFNQEDPVVDFDILWRRIRLDDRREPIEANIPEIQSPQAPLIVEQLRSYTPSRAAPLSIDQLTGRLAPSEELTDYEMFERPWALSGMSMAT